MALTRAVAFAPSRNCLCPAPEGRRKASCRGFGSGVAALAGLARAEVHGRKFFFMFYSSG